MSTASDGETCDSQLAHHGDGSLLIALDAIGTAVFGLTAVVAAVVFSTSAQWLGSITALTLFTVGVAAFLWSFWNALQRSREAQISVAQLYLLLGAGIPTRVRRRMNALVTLQFVIALATTLARPNGPDGSPGSSLAVGFLVPMFGFGLNGLWAAYHGRFAPRADENAEIGERIGQNGPMAESASEFTTINASLEEIWTVVTDIERYPDWAHDIKQAVVIERDESGRPAEVEFVAAALGRSTHYTLAYDYSDAPLRLSWKMVKGDIQREITGGYEFGQRSDGATDVRYDVIVELVVPLPGFVKRRAEVRILNTLKELKARVEAG